MSRVVEAPLEMVEAVAALRLPAGSDSKLQGLMDRNNEGALTSTELEELESLVELSETLAIVRARALHLLGRDPSEFLSRDRTHRTGCSIHAWNNWHQHFRWHGGLAFIL